MTLVLASAASLAARPISEQVLGQETMPGHSSLPSQQSQIPSPTRLLSNSEAEYPAFSQ